MRHLFALVSLTAIASTSPAPAARPSFSFEVIVEGPSSLETRLRQSLGEGLTCAAVARPVGMGLAQSVAVLLTRQKDAAPPEAANVRVLTTSFGDPDDLAPRLDAAAAQGFGICGLTFTSHIWGKQGGFGVVAVLTRTSTAPTGTTYRVLYTTGRRGEWALVQQAADDGFAVARLASRPQPDVSSTSDIVYVAEKTASARPVKYDMVLGGNGPGLQKDLDKSTARGFCAQATWATPERMTVLLAKPADAPCDRPHQYKVVETSAFMGLNVSFSDGVVLGIHRIKDATMALYDGKDNSHEYGVVEGVLVDEDSRPPGLPRAHRDFVDKLNADGGRGYRPVDAAWREAGADRKRAVDVILARPRE